MTRRNAFDLLNRLHPVEFQIIFVTVFDSHALRAFKYSAVDYLLKPVARADLCSAVERAVRKSQGKGVITQMEVLLQHVGNIQISLQKMAVPTVTGLVFITIGDIIRFEAKGSYTTIYLDNGDQVMAARNIKEYEDLLPAAIFCCVHNPHIINLQKIQKYHKGRGGYIIMEGGSSIEAASRRREIFLANFLK